MRIRRLVSAFQVPTYKDCDSVFVLVHQRKVVGSVPMHPLVTVRDRFFSPLIFT
jgi:hypothetical protein